MAALPADPGHLNPAITASSVVHMASDLVYNGLVNLGPDLEPAPELAERWKIEEDGAVYRFTLRKGVRWHDGAPLTSEDVKFTFEEHLLQFHARARASIGSAIRAIEAPDERTVVFRFRRPYATLLLQLDVTEAPIVAKHVYEGGDPLEHPANAAPIGTGPFSFVSYTTGSEIRLARNPAYFRDDLPYLNEVVQRIVPDPGSQVVALEAGEVDWLWNVNGPDVARLGNDPGIRLLPTERSSAGANCMTVLSFNLDRPALMDVRVRRAIAHAIDRQAFLERVIFNQGRVAGGPIASGLAWAAAPGLKLPEFDPAAASRLLEEAGWVLAGDGSREARDVPGIDDGTELTVDLPVIPPDGTRFGELARAQLGEVGIGVTVRPLEIPVYVETVFESRDFDSTVIGYCHGNDPDIGARRMYDSRQIGPIPASNASAYRRADVDRLFDEAQAVIDRDERARRYRRIQEMLVADLPYLWLVESRFTPAYRARCEGFVPYGHFAEAASCRP